MTKQTIDPDQLVAIRSDMLRFARLQLRDAAAAEDAVQEALLAAIDKAASFSGRSELKTWVFSILRHKIVDHIRRQARTTNASSYSFEGESLDQTFDALFKANAHWTPGARPSDWGDPQAALHQEHFWKVFEACLNHLPENTARVFMMREFLDFETPEVCKELGITVTNCNVILHRARNALRACLERGWFTTGEKMPC